MNRYVIKKDADPKFNIEMRQYAKITEVYPELEDLRVTPTKETQVFQHLDSYGYDNVKVTAIPEEYVIPEGELNINDNGEYDVSEYSKANVHFEVQKYSPRYIKQCPTFQDYTGTELNHEISMLDTSAFTKMSSMFYNCKNLISLDLSEWNTSNVTDMYNMFRNCQALTELDLSNFDTSNVTSMSSTFENCKNLKRLNISSWKTEKLQNTTYMFNNCSNLEFIDMRNFTFDNLTSYRDMFWQVNYYCEIIVKDETQKQWVLSQKNFANIKTVAEYEASI